MSDSKICCNDENHHHHMCVLKDSTNIAEVQSLSYKPTVKCGICGLEANNPENVCTPVKIFDNGQIS